MTFSEFASELAPYISFGKTDPDYFVDLIGNFIQDAAMYSCKLLDRKPDTQYRYIKGDRTFQPKDAQYLYDYRDVIKFSKWILERMDDSESYDNVMTWLKAHNIIDDDPAMACTYLLESIILDIINRTPVSNVAQETAIDLKLIDDIQKKIKSLPRPANVPVPEVATPGEQIYINELLWAYGSVVEKVPFSIDDLPSFPEYAEDLEDRRIDFYAAETIRRGVLELGGGSLAGQFDVLKEETLAGVNDTAKRRHNNGYDHMLAIMEQAVIIPITNYILSSSPYWISAKIKKGVCHHLVNDGELVWVRREKKK